MQVNFLPSKCFQMHTPELNKWLQTRPRKLIQYLHASHIANTRYALSVVTSQQVGQVDQLGPVQA